mgnify:CR=1 FL=1
MAKLYIYGTIGFDVEADYIRAALDDMEGEVELILGAAMCLKVTPFIVC